MRELIEIKSVDQIETIVTHCIEERETLINLNACDDMASIYTSDNVFLTKMKKAFAENPNDFKCYEMWRGKDGVTGYKFICPKELISVRKKRNTLSDEDKEKRSEMFKQLHKDGKIGRGRKRNNNK